MERWTQRGTNRGRRGTVAAIALPDTRQRLRRGAEHLGGDWDGDAIIRFDNIVVNNVLCLNSATLLQI